MIELDVINTGSLEQTGGSNRCHGDPGLLPVSEVVWPFRLIKWLTACPAQCFSGRVSWVGFHGPVLLPKASIGELKLVQIVLRPVLGTLMKLTK